MDVLIVCIITAVDSWDHMDKFPAAPLPNAVGTPGGAAPGAVGTPGSGCRPKWGLVAYCPLLLQFSAAKLSAANLVPPLHVRCSLFINTSNFGGLTDDGREQWLTASATVAPVPQPNLEAEGPHMSVRPLAAQA